MNDVRSAAQFRRKLANWFKRAGRDLPWRRTHDPYAVLVSEMMLQQTQVVTVLGYYERWLRRFPTWESLAAATESEVLALWQGLGYYSRARRLRHTAQAIVTRHGGQCPRTPEAIQALPGIGRYTAGAVATFAFDAPVPIVDANIARVLSRLFNYQSAIDTATGQAFLWRSAQALLPQRSGRLHNSALMELGALVCLPRNPKCEQCPVYDFCQANDPASLPIKKPRPKTVRLREESALTVEDTKILLEQETGSRWRGLWRLPLLKRPPAKPPLLSLEYPFTHHKITLSIYVSRATKPQPNQQWFDMGKLPPMPSPHRRAMLKALRIIRH